jgi:molybdopterin converting factor small subunit
VLGADRFEVEDVRTVADVVEKTKQRFGAKGDEFEKLTRVATVAVNGVLMTYRKGVKTPLSDGDVVSFVKAAAGG